MSKILLALFCLAITTSCMKKLSETDDDGPVVTANEVQASIFKAWDNTDDLSSIEQNEFVYVEREQRVQEMAPVLILQEGTTVAKREDAGDSYDYTLLVQSNEINGDESKLSTKERKFSVEKSDTASIAGQLSAQQQSLFNFAEGDNTVKPLSISFENMYGAMSLCYKTTGWDVSCHNLEYSEELQPPPELVRKQANCGGVPNCLMRIRRVMFDLILNTVESDNTTSRQKIKYNLAFSPDVPYLSRLVENCRRGLVMIPSAGQKILVNVCDYVRNFKTDQ